MVQVFIFMFAMYLNWGNLGINWFYVGVLYALYSLMSISFVLCWNAMFKTYVISMTVFTSIISLLALISGLTIEFSWIPVIIQKIAMILPTYWLTHGLIALNHSDLLHLVLTYIILIVFAIIFILVGSRRRFN